MNTLLGMLKKLSFKSKIIILILTLALVLYVLGLKFVFTPVLIGLTALYLPMPAIFQSWASRAVVGFLMSASLIQIAATIQFLLWPSSNFNGLALLVAVLVAGILLAVPQLGGQKRPVASGHDLVAAVVVIAFLLPFASIFAGNNSIQRIAEIGGIQAIDAINHYTFIAETTTSEHFSYAQDKYFPQGFHLATGFIQHSFVGQPAELSWQTNAVLFFLQYMVWGAVAAFMFYFLTASFLSKYTDKLLVARRWQWFIAISVTPVVVALYLLPFVNHGFLSYYYICTALLLGIIFLLHIRADNVHQPVKFFKDTTSYWFMLCFLLVTYGAAASWPLLVPVILLMTGLLLLPNNAQFWAWLRGLWHIKTVPLVAAMVLLLLPVYFQLDFSAREASQSINLTGGLKAFHGLILMAGIALLGVVLWGKQLKSDSKQLLLAIFGPLLLFVGALVLMQYFVVGEVRYYAIKSAILLELLFVALGVTLLTRKVAENTASLKKYSLLMTLVPFAAMVLLIGLQANPFKDLRDLFRDASGQEKPAFFDQDVRAYTKLGIEGKLKHHNSTLLHYNQASGKFVAHMQIPYWANVMQFDASGGDLQSWRCSSALYTNQTTGSFTPAEQRALLDKIKECANLANISGQKFYVVTDKVSAPIIKRELGDVVEVVF